MFEVGRTYPSRKHGEWKCVERKVDLYLFSAVDVVDAFWAWDNGSARSRDPGYDILPPAVETYCGLFMGTSGGAIPGREAFPDCRQAAAACERPGFLGILKITRVGDKVTTEVIDGRRP